MSNVGARSNLQLGRFSAAAVLLLFCAANFGYAQFNGNGFFRQAVGGVSVDADGVLGQPIAAGREELRQWYLKGMKPIPEVLQQPTEMRMVSFRALEAALAKSGAANAEELPAEIR
jgi:hypothetical protein